MTLVGFYVFIRADKRVTKKLIIMGNGLGMALDPEHFNLKNAMQRVWDCATRLTEQEKTIVGPLKGIDAATGPRSEDELSSTQLALSFLSSFRERLGEDALEAWFAPDARDYPSFLRKYIYEVAYDLFSYDLPSDKTELWTTFLEALIPYIIESKSHIATLNYDDLIYDKIVEGITINDKRYKPSQAQGGNYGLAPYVRDGFQSRGRFAPDTFNWDGDSGQYLHLHGSPLFLTEEDGETSQKIRRSELSESNNTAHRHIVLANRKDKTSIIRRSDILSDYWDERLPACISEASEIILFGYSGEDDHLNDLIKEARGDTPIVVIEWENALHRLRDNDAVIDNDQVMSPQDYWDMCLGQSVKLIQLENILTFTEWEAN